ncbi:MAG: hypothetical protein A3C90_00090 [Candidatus Magasanikbacteria bacterium RIFCSPHIGHO2_02_FULL_51_14]|uniref:Uncharacterized protein n=1 Tax=Candidatus Magasanikbacteria bacterium RIFCSPHIGHO2_02_FULL_51_14 TaxID=1798683 RepID=A0A1F6MD10_9BACT|nr:MAG: hypothetical protein A3C90_00090 [Candidatus Magasanikbacteria bacterium RIFCSPHIGHO2_02_FULL_51_14]
MFLLLKRSALFFLPVGMVVLFPFVSFYISGEFIRTADVVKAQIEDAPVLVGKALPFWGGEYSKIDLIKKKKPSVIALGNSRVLQFRDTFFINGDFFNGGGIGNLRGFTDVLEQLNDDEAPQMIIIGMDQSYFHPYSDENNVPDLAFTDAESSSFAYMIAAWRTVYKNIVNGSYPIAAFFSRKNDGIQAIGLQAYVQGAGNRNDGSYEYGATPGVSDPRSADYEFKDTRRRIQKGVNLFYKGDVISENAIAALTDFLDGAKHRGIHVVGFLPPYAQEIYDTLEQNGEYRYMFSLNERISPLFESYGYSFFDFSNMNSFGGKKDEIIDGLHASEKAYLRLFITMARADSVLGAYAKNEEDLVSLLDMP